MPRAEAPCILSTKRKRKSMGIRRVTSSCTDLGDERGMKSPQERFWCKQVDEHSRQNEHEASEQARWLYECQDQAL
eukprot:1139018-Pelagomonas_calceolata.AAC.8